MRQPTNLFETFASWRRRIAGETVILTLDPQCGFYRRKLVKHGPWVGVAIWIEQDIDPDTGELMADEQLMCLVNGKPSRADLQWSYVANNPIEEREYRYLIALANHASTFDVTLPHAQPRQAIDLLAAPIPF